MSNVDLWGKIKRCAEQTGPLPYPIRIEPEEARQIKKVLDAARDAVIGRRQDAQIRRLSAALTGIPNGT